MIINAEKYKKMIKEPITDLVKMKFHNNGDMTSVLIINASDDPANVRYINTKKKELDEYGIRCKVKKFGNHIQSGEIIDYIKTFQEDFDGVMIQTPIYEHLNYEELISAVDYKKDVDGLHPMNQGLLYSKNKNAIIPCTAVGVMNIMDYNSINYRNKKVVIVGRGKLVADPLAKILENRNCTVTKIHTKTDPDYSEKLIRSADIIISCVGKDMSHMINPNTVGGNLDALIGVGFRYEDGRQLQDFDINDTWMDAIRITGNTKSTGLATVCGLIENLIQIKFNNKY